MRKISALLYGFASILSLFTLLGKPVRRSANNDAEKLSSDWCKVGEDIKAAMISFDQLDECYGK